MQAQENKVKFIISLQINDELLVERVVEYCESSTTSTKLQVASIIRQIEMNKLNAEINQILNIENLGSGL